MSNAEQVTCPDCVEGKITAGCAIDRPLISIDCGRCKGTSKVSLPTIELPFSLDDIRRKASNADPSHAPATVLREIRQWLTMSDGRTAWPEMVERIDRALEYIRADLVSSAEAPDDDSALQAAREISRLLYAQNPHSSIRVNIWQIQEVINRLHLAAPAPSEDGAVVAARPKIVCLCGSTKFMEAFQGANLRLTLAGEIVLSVGTNTKSDAQLTRENYFADPSIKERLDNLHKRKIDLADYVFVLNVGGYIGESTRNEIEYATGLGRPVNYLESVTATPAAPSTPLLHCSCGAACTAEEYADHVSRGHDAAVIAASAGPREGGE